MYKVVIPSAGIGSRIGPYTKFMNKALVTINNRPAITHVIDNFPDAEEIVILLGYKGDYTRQVVKAFYPNKNISFVEVDVWDGPESGLGRSLNCARHKLQCPFIFVPNDTVIPTDDCNLDPTNYGNWMGWANTGRDNSQYRTLNISNKKVNSINPKGVDNANHTYIGLAGIRDYDTFWDTMDDPQAVRMGESYGMQALDDITAFEFASWCDIGNMDSLQQTREKLDDGRFNILEKENEAIWFNGDDVIKFSVDKAFIADRIQRLNVLHKDLFPKIISYDKNLYVYKMVYGDILSKKINDNMMHHILDTINEKMWQPNHAEATPELIASCYDFYEKKTKERVDLFHTKYEVMDKATTVNGTAIPSCAVLLDNINWDLLCENPFATAFHGDFHNENILVNDENNPILIDWRQNFGKGNYEIGDAYYDFAKFNHGLIVSHSMVHNDYFTVSYDDTGNITIDILRPSTLVDVEQEYYKWLNSNGFCVERTKILTALIYLNIAALHEYPYSMYLYYLGKQLLYKWGSENEYCNW